MKFPISACSCQQLVSSNFFFFFFWLRWVFVAVHSLSLVVGKWGLLFVVARGPLIAVVLSCCWAGALGMRASAVAACSLSGCSMQAQQLHHTGPTVCGLQQLWHTGSVAPWHVGSSQTRDWTRVLCTGRQIPNHLATREVPNFLTFTNVMSKK